MRRFPRNFQQYFTMIELVLVMAVMALVLAVTAPNLRNFVHGRNITEEARRFVALTRFAQNEAISKARQLNLWIDTQEMKFGLEFNTPYGTLEEEPKFTLPEGIELECAGEQENNVAIRFLPDGGIEADESFKLTFASGNGDELSISWNDSRSGFEICSEKEE